MVMVDRIGLGEFAGRRFSRKRKLNPRCVVAGEQLYSLRGKGRARLTFYCALLFGDHFRHYNDIRIVNLASFKLL